VKGKTKCWEKVKARVGEGNASKKVSNKERNKRGNALSEKARRRACGSAFLFTSSDLWYFHCLLSLPSLTQMEIAYSPPLLFSMMDFSLSYASNSLIQLQMIHSLSFFSLSALAKAKRCAASVYLPSFLFGKIRRTEAIEDCSERTKAAHSRKKWKIR